MYIREIYGKKETMRLLEIVIPIFIVAFLVFPVLGRTRPDYINAIPPILLGVTILHLLIEKYRWQMIPLYVLVGLLFLVWLRGYFVAYITTPIIGARIAAGLGILGALIGTALPALLPVPQVVAPTGPYQVGTATYVLIDSARKELYSGRDGPRKFMMQIWYPASPDTNAHYGRWMDGAEIVAPALAQYLRLPSFFLDHLALAKSSSYENAPFNVTGAPYPIILFSHGWNGFRAQSTFLMQELASHGYVVVSMEHTYGARLTVFPDGQIAPNNPEALPRDSVPQAEYEQVARILVNQWAGDLRYALDTLTQWNQSGADGRFVGMLDLEQVGVSGHSTGGGAEIEFCGTDPRCKAGFPLDPFMRPVSEQVLTNGISQPFAFFFSQKWHDLTTSRNNELFHGFRTHINPTDAVMFIEGTDHYDFSDIPALSPLAPQLKLKGPINGTRVQKIINTYVVAFFDAQFKGKATALFNGESADFPEVHFVK